MSIKLPQYLRYVLLFGAVLYILVYICVAYYRLQYSFELEWIEGSMVDHVQRIVNGRSIYVAPSFRFVPSFYPPLYFYVSAGVSAILGGGFLPLRLVSLVASWVSFGVIAAIVQEETHHWQIALLSAGLFAATFRATGAWLDIARVDSLFLLLWLLFVYFAIGKKTVAYAVVAGVFAMSGSMSRPMLGRCC